MVSGPDRNIAGMHAALQAQLASQLAQQQASLAAAVAAAAAAHHHHQNNNVIGKLPSLFLCLIAKVFLWIIRYLSVTSI